jgi:hypothetical protein
VIINLIWTPKNLIKEFVAIEYSDLSLELARALFFRLPELSRALFINSTVLIVVMNIHLWDPGIHAMVLL